MRDFLGLADAVIARDPGLAPCRATVEKELLHMEILEALRGIRAFPRLAFKGGTCLRLCRQGKRLIPSALALDGFDPDDSCIGPVFHHVQVAVVAAHVADPAPEFAEERLLGHDGAVLDV